MRHESHTLPLPSPVANGGGDAVPIKNLLDKYIQVQGGTYSFSIALQYSLDGGTTWHDLVAATGSAVEPTDFPQPATHARVLVSSYTSVTTSPTITLVGRNAETGP